VIFLSRRRKAGNLRQLLNRSRYPLFTLLTLILLHLDSSSSSPVKQPDNVQRRSETSSESPPPPTDISDRLLVLVSLLTTFPHQRQLTIHKTAAFIPITLKLVCQDKTEQVCQALSVLVPIFISVHLGAAFAAFVIPLNGGNPIFLRRLQLICEYLN